MTNPKTADQINLPQMGSLTITPSRRLMFKRKHPQAETMTVFQIEFQLKHVLVIQLNQDDEENIPGWSWQPIESECYGDAESANDRLKYFQGCSLGKVLDFRVSEREEKLK